MIKGNLTIKQKNKLRLCRYKRFEETERSRLQKHVKSDYFEAFQTLMEFKEILIIGGVLVSILILW